MDSRPDWLSLDADETVVWQGAPRIRRVLPTAAAAACWVALLALAVLLGPRVASELRVFSRVALAGVALLLALPALAAVASAYLRTTNVAYVLTERNLYRKSGVLSTRVSRIGLASVQRTSLTKNVWGNLFDYGTIEISTAGSDGVDLRLSDLNDPEPVRAEIRRSTGRRQSRSARDPTSTPLDATTADALLDDFRALHDAATRVERGVTER